MIRSPPIFSLCIPATFEEMRSARPSAQMKMRRKSADQHCKSLFYQAAMAFFSIRYAPRNNKLYSSFFPNVPKLIDLSVLSKARVYAWVRGLACNLALIIARGAAAGATTKGAKRKKYDEIKINRPKIKERCSVGNYAFKVDQKKIHFRSIRDDDDHSSGANRDWFDFLRLAQPPSKKVKLFFNSKLQGDNRFYCVSENYHLLHFFNPSHVYVRVCEVKRTFLKRFITCYDYGLAAWNARNSGRQASLYGMVQSRTC